MEQRKVYNAIKSQLSSLLNILADEIGNAHKALSLNPEVQ